MLKENKAVLLSIIIPVYNVEDYLEKCIISCMNIGLPAYNYEVIVVNDGSPDNSLAIANKLAVKYNNIVIYSKENGGLSSARNFGLEKSSGVYVWFFDSDDYIVCDSLQSILDNAMRKDLDIMFFNWLKVLPDDSVISNDTHAKLKNNTGVITGVAAFSHLGGMYFAPRCIFKRSLFVKDKFTEGIYYEDLDLVPRLFLLAPKVQGYNFVLFHYLQRKGSILNSINPKLITDALLVAEKYRVLIDKGVNLYELPFKIAIISALHNSVRQGVEEQCVIDYIGDHKVSNLFTLNSFKFKMLNILGRISPKCILYVLRARNRFLK